MKHTITGTIAQYATLELEHKEEVWASNGSLMSYSRAVSWGLEVPGGMAGVVKRSLSGEGISLTKLRAEADGQTVMLSANSPGHVLAWSLDESAVVTTRGSFLAAWGDIDISVTVARRTGAAVFGGVGLFLQRISGTGTVLVHGRGDLHQSTLGEGETRVLSTGNLAAFAETVDYDIETVGSVRRVFFSGEGLFMTRLTGPGRVIMQSLKPAKATGAS